MRVSSFAVGMEPARRYRVLPYFFVLELHRCHLTRRLVERWWSEAEDESVLAGWLDLLAAFPLPYRLALVRWLDRGGEIRKPVPASLDVVWWAAAALYPPEFVAEHSDDFVRELRNGATVSFIQAWLELRRDPESRAGLWSRGPSAEFPLARLRQLFGDQVRVLDDAFRVCSAGRDAAGLFLRPEMDRLTIVERTIVANFAHWVSKDADVLLSGLAAMSPDLRVSFAAHGYADMKYGLDAAGSEAIPAILRRWNGDSSLNELVQWLTYFPQRLHKALTALPDLVVSQLGKAVRGLSADARFDGGRYVIGFDGDRAFTWLASAPAHFIDTCTWVAGFGYVRARLLLRRAAALPLFRVQPGYDGSADWLVRFDRLLQEHATLSRRLPEFATWDKHFSGVKVLKRAAIEDVARRLAARIPMLQMWWLQDEIRRALAMHPEEHASLFRAMLTENRRPLTRFLREYSAQRDSRLDHPANRQWLARHGAGFDVDAWLDPPALTDGEITLAVERDPLEILKLGSYVGSCLSLGGSNAHAAVAIMLDVNKRVVFARNSRGRFVARQVVAISDDGKLICYGVYGNRSLDDAFERYATAWSARLGLPLAKGENHVSTERVRPLTVNSWYDDGLWKRFSA